MSALHPIREEQRTVFLSGEEYSLTVKHYPATRGSFEKGGLQISPDDPEEYEILSASIYGAPFTPSEQLEERLIEALFEQNYDDYQEEPEPKESPFAG